MAERTVLSPTDVAAYLGVDVETVYRWLPAGRIPGRKIGGRWLTRRDELDAALSSQRDEEAPHVRRGQRLSEAGPVEPPRDRMDRAAEHRPAGPEAVRPALGADSDRRPRRPRRAARRASSRRAPDAADDWCLPRAAVRAELVSRNVAGRDFVDTPRVPDREPDAFSADEVRALLRTVAGDRLEALYRLAVGTGLRSGELLGLAWQDIDLDGAQLSVRQELVRRDGRYLREEPKTPGSKRSVPLSPALVSALRSHRERLIAEGFVPTATGPVFVNRSGGPINGSWLTHHAQRLYERAGIRRLDFKALRATFGSRLFEAGVPDMEIAKLLGHTRTHTTKRHYISLGDRHSAALDVIEELVG